MLARISVLCGSVLLTAAFFAPAAEGQQVQPPVHIGSRARVWAPTVMLEGDAVIVRAIEIDSLALERSGRISWLNRASVTRLQVRTGPRTRGKGALVGAGVGAAIGFGVGAAMGAGASDADWGQVGGIIAVPSAFLGMLFGALLAPKSWEDVDIRSIRTP